MAQFIVVYNACCETTKLRTSWEVFIAREKRGELTFQALNRLSLQR